MSILKNPFNADAGKKKPENLATLSLVSGAKERKIQIDLDAMRSNTPLAGMPYADLTIIALATAKAIYSVGETAIKKEATDKK